ncbi:3'-5' exonuclease [Granulicoccus phenolivorans]|uniref:3'-5' exonuclease n=1 Tax=Granulicoccus phenolivorans TaxID=266854 RepID=UPI00042616B9|nr:3'-5' exonuclease [Granulicoccus phenolivorans]
MSVTQGYGAKFVIEDDTITKVSGRIASLVSGDGVRIRLPEVRGIRFRPAGAVTNGHLQVVSAVRPAGVPSMSEPTTVLFAPWQQGEFQQLARWLEHVSQINRSRGLFRRTPEALGLHGIRRIDLTRRPTRIPAHDQVFTAVDLETTGLEPFTGGIVEVGLVKFNGRGEVFDEFATLVRTPGSQLRAREIHGIDEAELHSAPDLAPVLRELWHFINGSVMVAHNLEFEAKFLLAGSNQAGVAVPGTLGLCTLETSRRQFDSRSYTLTNLYRVATGDALENGHSALADARAVMQVLLWLLREAPSPLNMPPGFEQPESDLGPRPHCAMVCRPVPLARPSLSALLESFPTVLPNDLGPSKPRPDIRTCWPRCWTTDT